jgi:molybdopterin-binding protein
MKLSGCNQLKGRIVAVTKGQTPARLRLDIGGVIVTSSIANEVVDHPDLTADDAASARIKAPNVIIAK